MGKGHWTDPSKDSMAVKMIDSAGKEEAYINIAFITKLVFLKG